MRRDLTTSSASLASQNSRSASRRAGVVEAALERRPVTRGLVEVAGQMLPMPGPEQRTDRLEPTRRSVDVPDPEGLRVARDRIRQVQDHRSILGEAEARPHCGCDRSARPDPAPACRRPCTGARWPPRARRPRPEAHRAPGSSEACNRASSGCCTPRGRSSPALRPQIEQVHHVLELIQLDCGARSGGGARLRTRHPVGIPRAAAGARAFRGR